MTLASRLGMSVDRCQQETPATKFWKWLQFIQEEQERPDWMDYYLAQIAFEIAKIRCMFLKDPKPICLGDFLIRKPGQAGKVVVVPEKIVTKKERIKEAKAYWGAFFAVHKAVQPSLKKGES